MVREGMGGAGRVAGGGVCTRDERRHTTVIYKASQGIIIYCLYLLIMAVNYEIMKNTSGRGEEKQFTC